MPFPAPLLCFLLLSLALATPSWAQTDCDRLAALGADPRAVSAGLPLRAIDGAAALAACDAALEGDPANPRLVFQRGRALLKLDRTEEALAAFQAAHEAGYPAATFALGVAYHVGTGVLPDEPLAITLYEQAFADGVAEAANGLAMLYSSRFSPAFDPEQARLWRQRYAQQKATP